MRNLIAELSKFSSQKLEIANATDLQQDEAEIIIFMNFTNTNKLQNCKKMIHLASINDIDHLIVLTSI